MEELLVLLVKAIVEDPEQVSIRKDVAADGKITFYIACATKDHGLVIGKEGRNINAIRTILKIMAVKEKVFVDVRLEE